MNKIPFPYRLILCLQAAMIAWIGFVHGTGLELYLFKFTTVSYKSVFSWDHNLATLVALLGLVVLWRPYAIVLGALSAIYLGLTLLQNRYGGFADDPIPLLGQAATIVMPLSALALRGQRLPYRLGQIGLVLSLGYTVIHFLNLPPYSLDAISHGFALVGLGVNEQAASLVLLASAATLALAVFLEGRGQWQPPILGLFGLIWAVQFAFATRLWPESVLRLSLLALALILTAGRARCSQNGTVAN